MRAIGRFGASRVSPGCYSLNGFSIERAEGSVWSSSRPRRVTYWKVIDIAGLCVSEEDTLYDALKYASRSSREFEPHSG